MRNAEDRKVRRWEDKQKFSSFSRSFLLLICGLLLTTSASSAVNSAFAQTKDEVVRSIEGHYRDLVDLTAKVVQKNNLKTLGKTQTFEGSLFIKKPGRLRLEYTNGQTIVLDGKTVWFYSKKSQQAIKRTFADIEQTNVPVAFLLGASEISREFDIAQAEGDGARTLDLSPKKPGAAMKKLRLKSDEAGRITEMTIFDKSGNTTEITFTDVKEGTGMEDKVFVFKAPKGTEIIEQ
jgi:outer membrane lipoprotein carrier protein